MHGVERAERTPLLRGFNISSHGEAEEHKRATHTAAAAAAAAAHSSAAPRMPPPYSHSSSSSSSSPRRVGSSLPPEPPPPPSRRQARPAARNDAVRRNLISYLSELQLEHLHLCLSCTFLLPQLVAIGVVLGLHWQPDECDQPLYYWSLGYAVRLFLSLLVSLLPFLPQSSSLTAALQSLLTSATTTELLHIFSFVWFIIGNYYLFHSTSCAASSPAVYQLVSALLLLNCLLIFLPLFLFLLCCPLLYFCTPFLLRSMAVIVQMSRERRGLSPESIDSLPSISYPRLQQRRASASAGHAGGMTADESTVSALDALPSECSICLSAFAVGDKCRVLSCHPSHAFHSQCVDEWLVLNANCPICRADIVVPDTEPPLPAAAETGSAAAAAADIEDDRRRRIEDRV